MPRIIRELLNNLFGLAVSDSIGIIVAAPPPPEEKITISPSKTIVQAGTLMYFEGQITVDGKPVMDRTMTLYIDGAVLGSATTDQYGWWMINWTPSTPGTYSFYAKG